MVLASRVTKTDALHPNQSPTPQPKLPNLQTDRRNYRVPAYAGSAVESIRSARAGRQQANSLLAPSCRGGASLVSRCRSNNQDASQP